MRSAGFATLNAPACATLLRLRMTPPPVHTARREKPVARAQERSAEPDGRASVFKPLLAGLVAVLLALVFAQLSSEVVEGETLTVDLTVLRGAQSLRTHHAWLADVMRDLSGLGSPVVLTLFTAAAAGYLVLVSARTTALLLATSAVGGILVVSVFKAAFGRARPDAAFAELVAQGLSFPSGHASMSAIVFLTVGTFTASRRERGAERRYIVSTAILMMLLVGLSRVALGVHWATDVLGGWTFGIAWTLAWLVLARWLSRGDRAEPAAPA